MDDKSSVPPETDDRAKSISPSEDHLTKTCEGMEEVGGNEPCRLHDWFLRIPRKRGTVKGSYLEFTGNQIRAMERDI